MKEKNLYLNFPKNLDSFDNKKNTSKTYTQSTQNFPKLSQLLYEENQS